VTALDRLTRRRLLAIAASAVALLAVGITVGVIRANDSGEQSVWVDLEPPVAMPDAVLTDASGAQFDLQERTTGRVTLLYFGYLNCVDVCPIHMDVLSDVVDTLEPEVRDQIDVIFVTTDPERDTPAALGEFLANFDASFSGLTGSARVLRDLQVAAGLPVAVAEPVGQDGSYVVGHATQVLVFGRDGVARRAFPFGVRQTDWARVLPQIVEEGTGS